MLPDTASSAPHLLLVWLGHRTPRASKQKVAAYLLENEKVEKVYYLGLLHPEEQGYDIYQKQCTGPGAMISFDIVGGEKEAFEFLNALKLIKLAVSLGSTESLVQHPMTMTHAGVDPEHRKKINITEKMIRISVGVENAEDIINDIKQALVKSDK